MLKLLFSTCKKLASILINNFDKESIHIKQIDSHIVYIRSFVQAARQTDRKIN